MNSTSRATCTGFVPESITGGIAAGQDSGARYRSLLEMKRTTGFADLQESGKSADDQHIQVPGSTGVYRVLPARVVPNLYRALAFLVAALLLPAAGIAIGTVGSEVSHRAAAEERAARYPVGDPTRCHVRALTEAASLVPALGIDWRWAELDSKGAVGTAILRARIVLIDPEIECADVAAVAFHEWTHIAVADQFGDAAQPPTGTVASDLVDDETRKPYVVARHEVVADCASALLLDQHGYPPAWHVYADMMGGCAPDLMASAREVLGQAGVRIAEGTATPLSEVGAGVYRYERNKAGAR